MDIVRIILYNRTVPNPRLGYLLGWVRELSHSYIAPKNIRLKRIHSFDFLGFAQSSPTDTRVLR